MVYTGPVDAYFGYRLGALQYRSVRFETEVLDTDNYQGNAVVNYTDAETPYTRIIEHKHFEFGTQPKTVISREYSAEWKKGDEPYYPVNDEKNGALYAAYKKLADAEPGAFCRSICSIINRTEYYLISATRVHCIQVMNKTFHCLMSIFASHGQCFFFYFF